MGTRKGIIIVNGIVAAVLSALLLADGVLELTGAINEALLSLPTVKLFVGIIALLITGAFLGIVKTTETITQYPPFFTLIFSARGIVRNIRRKRLIEPEKTSNRQRLLLFIYAFTPTTKEKCESGKNSRIRIKAKIMAD